MQQKFGYNKIATRDQKHANSRQLSTNLKVYEKLKDMI